MLIIGSTAMKHHGYDVEPKDLDIVMYPENIMKYIYDNGLFIKKVTDTCISCNTQDNKQVEIFIAQPNNSWSYYLDQESINRYRYLFLPKMASKKVLLSIKKGHINFPIGVKKFEKHIKYYDILLKDLKEDSLTELTKVHFKSTEERRGKLKTPSLNRSSEMFFDNKVKTFFVHDEIHMIMSHYDRPLYERMKGDGKVLCSEKKFNEFSWSDRVATVLEEAYVIALERKIIPILFRVEQKYYTSDEAFRWALYRICTTLTSGFFRQFAVDNYVDIYSSHSKSYVDKFLRNWQEGKIKTNEKSNL